MKLTKFSKVLLVLICFLALYFYRSWFYIHNNEVLIDSKNVVISHNEGWVYVNTLTKLTCPTKLKINNTVTIPVVVQLKNGTLYKLPIIVHFDCQKIDYHKVRSDIISTFMREDYNDVLDFYSTINDYSMMIQNRSKFRQIIQKQLKSYSNKAYIINGVFVDKSSPISSFEVKNYQ